MLSCDVLVIMFYANALSAPFLQQAGKNTAFTGGSTRHFFIGL